MQDEGWNILSFEPQKGDDWYKTTIDSMLEDQIYIDCHVNELLIFPTNTDLHQHWMVTDGYLLLQDKVQLC